MKIEWKGGERPVDSDVRVHVWLRCGFDYTDSAGEVRWNHLGTPGDVVAYEVLSGNQLTTLDKMDLHEKAFRVDDYISQPVVEKIEALAGRLASHPDANVDPNTETFGPLPEGNGDANGEGKQTNPKDLIGSRKAKFSVIPAGVLFDLGNAMTEGMCKYGRHNYRHAGIRASVYYDAACGHLADWWEGQDIDSESGLSHVTKALASLVVLRDAMLQGMMTDDRPPRSKVFKSDFSPMTAEIIDRHKDKNPRHFTIADTREAT